MQEIFGISAYVERRARDLAGLGYVVLAPEIYWRLGGNATEPIEGPDALQEGVARSGAVDWDAAVADGVATVRALRERQEVHGGGVGLVGFCFGGGLAFAVASALETQGDGVDALVSYYGSALPGLVDHVRVAAPSLHHFGLADDFIPIHMVRHIEDVLMRGSGTAFVTHDGANHAFDNDDMQWFHRFASDAAWAGTAEFLADQLPPAV